MGQHRTHFSAYATGRGSNAVLRVANTTTADLTRRHRPTRPGSSHATEGSGVWTIISRSWRSCQRSCHRAAHLDHHHGTHRHGCREQRDARRSTAVPPHQLVSQDGAALHEQQVAPHLCRRWLANSPFALAPLWWQRLRHRGSLGQVLKPFAGSIAKCATASG